MKKYEVENHKESLLPEGADWQLIWHDEFDGETLDLTKWDYRLYIMGERHETFIDEGAVLDGNSNLMINLVEKDGHYYCPHLQTGYNFMDKPSREFGGEYECNPGSGKTKLIWPIAHIEEPKFMHKYGYYEIRCKLQSQPGWWSAFWLQSSIIGATMNPEQSGVEVDIMESFNPDGIIYHNLHWNGYGDQHEHLGSGKKALSDTSDGFHIFGLDWSENGYTFYVDGKESWHVDGPVSNIEQFILISAECKGYRDCGKPSEELKKAILPDAFIVDYVRVFDRIN